MADYSLLLAEIDKYQNMARLADQQRIIVEDEIMAVTEKIRRVEEDSRREKEAMYSQLAASPSFPQHQVQSIWPSGTGREGSATSLYQSASHRIKDSIRTLPGFTEFVKNSELLEAFRQSYAKDIQDYCRQNTSTLQRDINMSVTNSEALESSDGKDKLNYLYQNFKQQKEASKRGEDRRPHHNNTIKEEPREDDEDHTITGLHDRTGYASKSSTESPLPAKYDSSSKSVKQEKPESRQQAERKQKPNSALADLRPDLKESVQSEDRDGVMQVPSDAHIHRYHRMTANSDIMETEAQKMMAPPPQQTTDKAVDAKNQTQNSKNKWFNERDPAKTHTTHKTTSVRDDDLATNFGNNVSMSDDKSGLIMTPQKIPPQRNTVTSDNSQPIKTTSKKDDVLTFRRRDSASKIRFTAEETLDLGNHKESYFDKENSAGTLRSNAKTNMFQDVSHRNLGEQSEMDFEAAENHNDYIHEEDHDRIDEREYAENPGGTSLEYSHTRRYTTEENFYSANNTTKRSNIVQNSNDRFRLRGSRETNKQGSNLQRKDDNSFTMNYAPNLTAMPSVNHFDTNNTFEKDKTLNIISVVPSEIQKNYGFGAEDMSLIRKPSQRSNSNSSPSGTMILRGNSVQQKQSNLDSPEASPIGPSSNLRAAFNRDDSHGNKNKEMLDRFDTFFKKMAIDEQDRWEDTCEMDDTRLQFLKDSNLGYDEYLEAIGHKKTTAVTEADKTVHSTQNQGAKANDRSNTKVNQSKSISYLSDFPCKINLDGPSIGLRIEPGGAMGRETMNTTIKVRDTEFDSARVTTEKIMNLVKSEITDGIPISDAKSSKRREHHESGVSGSVYPKTIQESNVRSMNTYGASVNYNYRVNEPIEDEPEDDEFEDWRPQDSEQPYTSNRDLDGKRRSVNRNRFSNDNHSLSQPSEEIDEVFIDERLIMPAIGTVRQTERTEKSSRLPSGKSNVMDSQLEDDEISLSMGTKNPNQIFKNKLSQRVANNRYG